MNIDEKILVIKNMLECRLRIVDYCQDCEDCNDCSLLYGMGTMGEQILTLKECLRLLEKEKRVNL